MLITLVMRFSKCAKQCSCHCHCQSQYQVYGTSSIKIDFQDSIDSGSFGKQESLDERHGRELR